MNRREAIRKAKATLHPDAFAGVEGSVVVPLHESDNTLLIYHPDDLKRMINACAIALATQGITYLIPPTIIQKRG
jgi:hypothetical protein